MAAPHVDGPPPCELFAWAAGCGRKTSGNGRAPPLFSPPKKTFPSWGPTRPSGCPPPRKKSEPRHVPPEPRRSFFGPLTDLNLAKEAQGSRKGPRFVFQSHPNRAILSVGATGFPPPAPRTAPFLVPPRPRTNRRRVARSPPGPRPEETKTSPPNGPRIAAPLDTNRIGHTPPKPRTKPWSGSQTGPPPGPNFFHGVVENPRKEFPLAGFRNYLPSSPNPRPAVGLSSR